MVLCVDLPDVHAQDGRVVSVRRAAEKELVARYPKSPSSTNVRVRRLRGEIDTTARLRVVFADQRGTPRGLARADVHARESSGSWVETGWALLHVAHYDSVVTTRTRIRAGETVSPDMVEVARIETTDFVGSPVTTADYRSRLKRGKLVAARLVQSGRPLREADVRRPYAAETGGAIDVYYRRGRFSLRLSCKAREPGFADETIRVYCPDIRKTYRATIVAENAARWVETL